MSTGGTSQSLQCAACWPPRLPPASFWFSESGGDELRRPPTREELRTLQEGDGVLLKHGISKNDPFRVVPLVKAHSALTR